MARPTSKFNRIMSLLLAVVMLCGLIPILAPEASAAEIAPKPNGDTSSALDGPINGSSAPSSVKFQGMGSNGKDISFEAKYGGVISGDVEEGTEEYAIEGSFHVLRVKSDISSSTGFTGNTVAFCLNPELAIGNNYNGLKWSNGIIDEEDALLIMQKDPTLKWFYAGYYNTVRQRTTGKGDPTLPYFSEEMFVAATAITQLNLWSLLAGSHKTPTYDLNSTQYETNLLNMIKIVVENLGGQPGFEFLKSDTNSLKAVTNAIINTGKSATGIRFDIYKFDDEVPVGAPGKGQIQNIGVGFPSTPTNTVDEFYLKLSKVDSTNKKPLAGATFSVTVSQMIGGSVGWQYDAPIAKDYTFTVTDDPDDVYGPFYAFSNGLSEGTGNPITITEIKSPAGYSGTKRTYTKYVTASHANDPAKPIVVDDGGGWENPKKAEVYFKLVKQDKDTKAKLAGAVFSVYSSDPSSSSSSSLLSITTKSSGDDTYGPITFESMDKVPANFWLVETKAPDGYKLDKTPIKVTVDKSQHKGTDENTVLVDAGTKDNQSGVKVYFKLIKNAHVQ